MPNTEGNCPDETARSALADVADLAAFIAGRAATHAALVAPPPAPHPAAHWPHERRRSPLRHRHLRIARHPRPKG